MKEVMLQMAENAQLETALRQWAFTNPLVKHLQAAYKNEKTMLQYAVITKEQFIEFEKLLLMRLRQVPDPYPPSIDPPPPPKQKTVFISYCHADKDITNKICDHIVSANIEPIIDHKHANTGQLIEQFIQEQVKKNEFVISVISFNSLTSGWVGSESSYAIFNTLLGYGKFLPVRTDNTIIDANGLLTCSREIRKKIANAEEKIEEARLDGLISTQTYEKDRQRMVNLQLTIDLIFNFFRERAITDISDQNFEDGMQKLINTIIGNNTQSNC